jgi:hypothetical protein
MLTRENRHAPRRLREVRGPLLWGRFEQGRPRGPTRAGVLLDGYDVGAGQPVAIEIGEELASFEARADFLRQAALAQSLDGDHVLAVLASGTMPAGTPVVVRETWTDDLAGEIAAHGAVAAAQAASWTLDVADAIARAHARGLVHGDLSLASVRLVTAGDELPLVKVAWPGATGRPGVRGETGRPATPRGREGVAEDLRGLGRILRALASGIPEGDGDGDDGAKTLPDVVAHVVARALASTPSAGAYANVAELARDLAPLAPEGHVTARTIETLLRDAATGTPFHAAGDRPDPHAGDPVQPVPWLGEPTATAEPTGPTGPTGPEIRRPPTGLRGAPGRGPGTRLVVASVALTALAIAFTWALDRALPTVGTRPLDPGALAPEADGAAGRGAPPTRVLAEAVTLDALWSPGRGLPAQTADAEPEAARTKAPDGDVQGAELDQASPSPLVLPERAFMTIPLGILDL